MAKRKECVEATPTTKKGTDPHVSRLKQISIATSPQRCKKRVRFTPTQRSNVNVQSSLRDGRNPRKGQVNVQTPSKEHGESNHSKRLFSTAKHSTRQTLPSRKRPPLIKQANPKFSIQGMKVLAKKGAKAVYAITCDSREWMTVLCCVNPAGQAIPSYYIFKGSRITMNYIQHCEPGAAMAMQKKAWMTGELFQAWLEHFDNAITQTMGKGNRHLLILDGHGSHVSLDVIAKAHNAGIDIITLPVHTSHKLQPLDVSVFKSLKVQFRKERDIWQQQSASRQATKTEVASLVGQAIQSSFTESNIKAGFRATGIWPLNAMVVRFEGMPSNYINLIEDTAIAVGSDDEDVTTRLRSEVLPSNCDENVSQVPSTPMYANREDEAIFALHNMAAQVDEDILKEHVQPEQVITFTQLMEGEDVSRFQDGHMIYKCQAHQCMQTVKMRQFSP
ncbi:hypothetical protein GOP47_0002101 [Adiantum capillus-veneris]|uniref:DDE-1 domain-containing protein n=1 Tax=Adiantum capillus-veneris TaxID=13818 RepID=A0A9D4ZNR2_ADICA|nr:hypothetical protein GOP47_0002101 [Adiantum capillus-veneris]